MVGANVMPVTGPTDSGTPFHGPASGLAAIACDTRGDSEVAGPKIPACTGPMGRRSPCPPGVQGRAPGGRPGLVEEHPAFQGRQDDGPEVGRLAAREHRRTLIVKDEYYYVAFF